MSTLRTPQLGSSPEQEQLASIRSTARPPASHRRFTPFQTKSQTRRIGAPERRFPVAPDGEEPACFTGLVNTTFQTYKVTPLFNFNSDTAHLKKYGKFLSAFLEAEKRKGDAVDIEGETADKVEISHYKGLRVASDDPEAIQILMRTLSDSNGAVRTVLKAYLLGVDMEESLGPQLNPNFQHYPVMLVRGPVRLAQNLTDWLKTQFDCSVSRLIFSSLDLTWILAMWSGQLAGGAKKPVELMYTMPDGIDGLDKITLTINAEDCKEVWDCIHQDQYEDVSTEEVAAFVTCLENHIYHQFKLQLTAMHLARVGTSLALTGAEGKLKPTVDTRGQTTPDQNNPLVILAVQCFQRIMYFSY